MYPGTHAERQPDKAAVVMAASGETVTYRQLDQRSNRLAQLLWDRGLRPGDAIAFSLENNARSLKWCGPPNARGSTTRRSTPA